MTDEIERFRSLLGASASLWAGATGVRMEPGRWAALSGARSVDLNIVLCHGASGGELLSRSIEEIGAAGVPAIIMVAGKALGEVQRLVEAGWVCVGSAPFMAYELDIYPAAGESSARLPARPLGASELATAHGLIGEAFGIGRKLAAAALPPEAMTRPGHAVWGAFDAEDRLVSCLAAVRVDEIVAIWSMATIADARGHRHGIHLLNAALADAGRMGARTSLLYSSPAGEPVYRAFGYRQLERWQLWSRPRWVMAAG